MKERTIAVLIHQEFWLWCWCHFIYSLGFVQITFFWVEYHYIFVIQYLPLSEFINCTCDVMYTMYMHFAYLANLQPTTTIKRAHDIKLSTYLAYFFIGLRCWRCVGKQLKLQFNWIGDSFLKIKLQPFDFKKIDLNPANCFLFLSFFPLL